MIWRVDGSIRQQTEFFAVIPTLEVWNLKTVQVMYWLHAFKDFE